MEKFEEQIDRAEARMRQLESELPEALDQVNDERDIREIMKAASDKTSRSWTPSSPP